MACLLVDTPDKSASSASKAVQDICDIYGEELGAVPPDLILALRSAFDKNCSGKPGVLVRSLVQGCWVWWFQLAV